MKVKPRREKKDIVRRFEQTMQAASRKSTETDAFLIEN